MHERVDAPPDVVDRLRRICAALPETKEQEAWIGTRWVIRQCTYAHVAVIEDGWPPAFVKAFGTEGPACVLTFTADGDELAALGAQGHPFVRPPWRPGAVGMFLEEDTDWDEVAELVTESYCLHAPRKLVGLVERPEAHSP